MKKMMRRALPVVALVAVTATLSAQAPPPQQRPAPPQQPPPATPQQPPVTPPQPPVTAQPSGAKPPAPGAIPATGVTPPPGYVIGPDDVLNIVYWREKDMSAKVTVRPDGQISLPLLNEMQVSGLTPEQLREKVTTEAAKFVEEPNVTVVVEQINSRRVYVTGSVAKPGPYVLSGQMTIVQLLSLAGGLLEFADSKNILITRVENGKQVAIGFNYKDFIRKKNLKQNIDLKPGDTIIVP